MNLRPVSTKQFKRDAKKYFEILMSAEWAEVMYHLLNEQTLPAKYRDHQLTGNFQDYRECHIKPDWLLIYAVRERELHLARLGTHSELFG